MSNEMNKGPVETGAEMDYDEHNKTFNMFYGLTKWSTIVVIAILVLMAMFLL